MTEQTEQPSVNPSSTQRPTGFQAFGFGSLILLCMALFAYSDNELFELDVPAKIDLQPEILVGFFTAFLILIVLIEAACGVIINIIFGRKTHATDIPNDGLMQVGKRTRFLVSQVFCIFLAFSIAFAGFRILDWIVPALGMSVIDGSDHAGYFHKTDLFLSALLLAGGAERFHQVIKNVFRNDAPQPDNDE